MCLWSWFAGSCAYKHYCGVHLWPLWAESVKQRDIEREVPFFPPPWFHDSLDFPLREACFYVTFPALFFSPPSRSLQPQGSQLASLSGCLLSGSEGSSNSALTPRLLASQVTHTLTSPPLFCCSQTRVAGGEIINHSALRCSPPPNHRHCNSLSAICWYRAATETQTEISAVI